MLKRMFKNKLVRIIIAMFICALVLIAIGIFESSEKIQAKTKKELVMCQEKYSELYITEVLPDPSADDMEKIRNPNGYLGFEVRFTKPLHCNGKEVKKVSMSSHFHGTYLQLLIPMRYKNILYMLKNIQLYTFNDGRDVFIKEPITLVKVR